MDTLPDAVRPETFSGVIRLDEGQGRSHVDRVVRESVEQTLNGLLEAEADQLCQAGRYERSPDRLDTRPGHYSRRLQTTAGEVTLKMPRLRGLPFETQIIGVLPAGVQKVNSPAPSQESGQRR